MAEDIRARTPPRLCDLLIDCNGPIVDEPKIMCRFSVLDADGDVLYDDHAGVERRGRSSRLSPKKNYSVELRRASGEEQPTPLLGMGGEEDWILDGSWVDRSLLRNQLVADLYRSLGRDGERWAPEGRFCRLELNGRSRGIYRLVERIKADESRLDLHGEHSFVIKQKSGGAVQWVVGRQKVDFRVLHPRGQGHTLARIDHVRAWMRGFSVALSDSGGEQVFQFLDLDATVDFVIVQELAKNVDAYHLSLHVFKDHDGLAQLVPWDFDLSMGVPAVATRSGLPRLRQEVPQHWTYKRTPLIHALARTSRFRERLVQRWGAHRRGPLAGPVISARLDDYVATLAPGVEENFEIWPIEDVSVRQIYRPFSMYPVTSYLEEIRKLRAWLGARLVWMDKHIADFPR
ncbi:MAG: CotH kinase family protein [Nannocystaceae bacterium]